MRVFLVALALLVVGFLNIARGLDHRGPDYRPWALHHGSYSDVVALSGDRYLHHEHPVPYVDDRIEYPVVIGLLLWLPSWMPGGLLGQFAVTSLLLAACLLWTLSLLRRVPGANPWLLAATPAVALYGVLNWDLVGIALMVAAVVALDRDRARWRASGTTRSGALLGLAIATKLFPAAAVPALLRRVQRPARWIGAIAAVVLVVNIPFAIAAFENWKWFFTFSSHRSPDFAIWNALHVTSVGLVNVLSLAAVGAAGLLALRYGRNPAAARFGTAFVIAIWMVTNKVSSPQYSLWVFAAAALVGAPWPIFAALVVGSTFDFAVELWLLPHHGLTLAPAATVMVAVRTAATLWFAWWCFGRLRVQVAVDQGAQGGYRRLGDGAGVPDRLDLAR
jgi:uncharacterized membrane protein